MLPNMTRPPSGSVPRRVDDPVAARLLLDATTREVFGCFLDRDRSVREAADLLERGQQGCAESKLVERHL